MNRKREHLLAAPMKLRFQDGFEVTMHPLTDADMAALDQWLRSRMIQVARESLPQSATQAERDEVIGLAMRQAMGMTWMSGEGAKMMGTPDGIAAVVRQSCHDQAVSHEDLRRRLFDPNEVEHVVRTFKLLNPQSEKPDRPTRPGNRPAKRTT